MKGKENKPHIGIYGRRNNGKSSLINRLSGQEIAIVSDIAGTTTDPVKRSFEILGFGPVILIDTAGIDDSGELGQKRIDKTLQTLNNVDLAILLLADEKFDDIETGLIKEFNDKEVPFIVIHNKSDIAKPSENYTSKVKQITHKNLLLFSALTATSTQEIIDAIKNAIPESSWSVTSLVGDLVKPDDIVLLITPIDTEAPEGRMILPQVQVIRDVLDQNSVCIVLKENAVEKFLKTTGIKPHLAVTDSQMFDKADAMIPKDIPLTGFSVLLARHRGPFSEYLKGTPKISTLKDNDRVLILESCSHHVSCEDIGRHKIPKWMTEFTGKKLQYEIVAGLDKLPRNVNEYALVVQCGGCVITRRQIIGRLKPAIDAGVPVTNYGMAIAYMKGIYERAIAPFSHE